MAWGPRGPRSGQTQAQRGTWRGSERGRVDTGSRHLRPSTGPMGRWTPGGEEMGRKAAAEPPPTLSQLSTVGSPSRQNTAESARQPSVLLDRALSHSQAPPFRTQRPSHGVLRANRGWGRGGEESPFKIEKSQFPPLCDPPTGKVNRRELLPRLGKRPFC